MDESEEWRDIDGAPNYVVSNQGKVQNRITGRILKPNFAHGRPTVNIKRNGEWISTKIEQLVKDIFMGRIIKLDRPHRTSKWVIDKETGEHRPIN